VAVTKYTQRNLIPGEHIVYAAELHKICYLFPAILLVIGMLMISWPTISKHIMAPTQTIEDSSGHYDTIRGKVTEHFSFIERFIPQPVYEALATANAVRQIVFGLLFLTIGIGTMVNAYLKKISTEQVITNKKIIHKQGFIKVDEAEISLHNLEGVKVFQSVFDRLLGRGTVQVNGVGMEQLEIKGICDPDRFRHNAYIAVEHFVQRHH
jgi:hypothetical protein